MAFAGLALLTRLKRSPTIQCTSKGQIISKGFLMSSISSKKRTKEFNFITMITQVDWFSFVFWRKLKTPKNHFEII